MAPLSRPSSSRRGIWALVALAVVGVVVAIGAIANLGPFANDEPTTAQFLAQGDEICKQARDQFLALQHHPARTAAGAAELTQKLIAISEDELNEIRALDAPAQLRSALDRYLAARSAGIGILRQGLAAAERKDAAGYLHAQSEIAKDQVHRLQLARAVGFTECSRPLIQNASASG